MQFYQIYMRMLCILLEYATTSVCGGSHKSNADDGGDVTILIIQFYPPPPPPLTCIPSLLTLSRNPKLRAIPSLANDLETIFHMICITDDKEPSQVLSKRTCQEQPKSPSIEKECSCP
ncbi:hypothetical protein TorRG33x02_215020 [Trema orientale]|uniref:Uncharacterized protein n=1 Tax=Trema orientale TaxID=63057 RepID=A0A2P5EB35_TREOI|nr:hypothetical protein TorRG33x02_215020 [Trema orientale]